MTDTDTLAMFAIKIGFLRSMAPKMTSVDLKMFREVCMRVAFDLDNVGVDDLIRIERLYEKFGRKDAAQVP